MKEYPKTYEDCYTRETAVRKCKIEYVTNGNGISNSEYNNLFESELRRIMENIFDMIVRFSWLHFGFEYKGYKRRKTGPNYFVINGAFGVYMRHFIGIDYRVFSRNPYYSKIVSYFKDFFKDFDKHNPFEEPEYYKYPYKHVTIDFLTIVAQMPDRLDLLQMAEDKKLKWDVFMDYVINHALCHNDKINKKMYTIINPVAICSPYIRNNMRKNVSGGYKIL